MRCEQCGGRGRRVHSDSLPVGTQTLYLSSTGKTLKDLFSSRVISFVPVLCPFEVFTAAFQRLAA